MPLYVFKCTSCGKEQEVMQKYDAPPPVCDNDECLSKQGVTSAMIRQLGNTSFQLKGGGWYKDGYSSSKKG